MFLFNNRLYVFLYRTHVSLGNRPEEKDRKNKMVVSHKIMVKDKVPRKYPKVVLVDSNQCLYSKF